MAKSYQAGIKVVFSKKELNRMEDADATPSEVMGVVVRQLGSSCIGGMSNLRVRGIEGSIRGFEDATLITCESVCEMAMARGCPLRTLGQVASEHIRRIDPNNPVAAA